MAARDYVDGMNDCRLKPRLLRSLTRDCLPAENRPFPSPTELSSVLSSIKTHGLLSERVPDPSDRKLIEAWRSAVDAWVDRVLSLASSNLPDKCWAGICLLGVTCEECSSDRFVASYSLWFQKLLSNIQPPSSTHFVKVSSCASLADIFTRLAGFSNLKKDATSLAGKLIQPVLQLFNEDGAEVVWEGAIDLLCTLITFFPSSVHRHYDNVETALVSKIMLTKCNANMSKKFACCLALLPKVRGDEDSWSLLMQKIVVAINMVLNDAFQGLEEEAKSYEIMKLLVPPGKDPPPPLGGKSIAEVASEQAMKGLHKMLAPKVSTLMHCCCVMLTNPYPVQVTVPIHILLALVGRVLRVDGSLHGSLLLFTTAMHQELLCAELPALHLDCLDLLIAIIKGVRSQLLPHAANVVRLLTEYFRRAALPSMRIKVYSIVHTLLISMGVGMALYLAQEVIDNAFADLNDGPGSSAMSSSIYPSKVAMESLQQSSQRKRKLASESLVEQPNGIYVQVEEVSRKPLTPLSVKIAALRALEALLTVGGSLRSECWRSSVDLLLIQVATNACDGGWLNEGKFPILVEESSVSRADFQLAALEALLASLLSPAHVRPPFLSQALELFRRGKQETGTKLASFCAHALLAVEVLIHPRALPLVDYPLPNSSTFGEGFHSKIQTPSMTSFSRGNLGAINDLDDDDFYDSLIGDGEGTALDGNNLNRHSEIHEQSVRVPMEETQTGKDVVANTVQGHEFVGGRQELPHSIDAEKECSIREDNVGLNKEPNPVSLPEVPVNDPNSDLSKDFNASKSLDAGAFPGNEVVAATDDMVLSDDLNLNKDFGSSVEGLFSFDKGKEKVHGDDSGSDSMSSLPDIVDGDPDSVSD